MKDFRMKQTVALRSDSDRLYVFNDNVETVIDRNGTVLFSIADVARPSSIDETGNIYLMKAQPADLHPLIRIEGRRQTSGEKIWDRDIQGKAGDPVRWLISPRAQFNCLPMYQNGTLYVPLTRGIVALELMGRTMWWSTCPGTATLSRSHAHRLCGQLFFRQQTLARPPRTSDHRAGRHDPTAPWQFDSNMATHPHGRN